MSRIALGVGALAGELPTTGSMDGHVLVVRFPAAVDPGSATNLVNYRVMGTGYSLTNVSLLADGATVALAVSPPVSYGYDLLVTNVYDLAMATKTAAVVSSYPLGFTPAELISGQMTAAPVEDQLAYSATEIRMASKTRGFSVDGDEVSFAYTPKAWVTDGFYAKVSSIGSAAPIGTAGFMFRENAGAKSRFAAAMVRFRDTQVNGVISHSIEINQHARTVAGGPTEFIGSYTNNSASSNSTSISLSRGFNNFRLYSNDQGAPIGPVGVVYFPSPLPSLMLAGPFATGSGLAGDAKAEFRFSAFSHLIGDPAFPSLTIKRLPSSELSLDWTWPAAEYQVQVSGGFSNGAVLWMPASNLFPSLNLPPFNFQPAPGNPVRLFRLKGP